MASTSLLLATLALMMLAVTVQAQAPPQNKYAERVKECHDKNKDVDKFATCLKELWHELRPAFATGMPEANILPLDPLTIDDFHIDEKGTVVDVKATFSDIIVKGASKFEFLNLNIHKANKSMTGTLKIPDLNITGQYLMEGTILLLPVNGKGPFTLNLTNVVSDCVGHLSRKGDVLNMDKLDISFKIEIIKIALDGFGEDDAVGDAVKNMLNDNSQEILEDIRPQLSEKVSKILITSLGGAFKSLPEEFGI